MPAATAAPLDLPAPAPDAPVPMQKQPDHILKHVAIVGVIALVGYFSFYALDSRARAPR